jgi:hypothetical protein
MTAVLAGHDLAERTLVEGTLAGLRLSGTGWVLAQVTLNSSSRGQAIT